jgi:hypothetical protein
MSEETRPLQDVSASEDPSQKRKVKKTKRHMNAFQLMLMVYFLSSGGKTERVRTIAPCIGHARGFHTNHICTIPRSLRVISDLHFARFLFVLRVDITSFQVPTVSSQPFKQADLFLRSSPSLWCVLYGRSLKLFSLRSSA